MECPIAGALEQVGEWWTLLILRDVLDGFSRFDELESNLGIAPNMLTRRLKGLVDGGLLAKVQYSERPARHEYVPTARARELGPVIVALYAWGNKHVPQQDRRVVLVDGDGRPIDPVLVDRETGQSLRESRAQFLPGPAASEAVRRRLDPELRAARRSRRNGPAAVGGDTHRQ
ncbi:MULTISPECIES: winged helix-turn-helix transcriptional regulator [Nocardiaceae]|uniref:winged helix-turn-helix transcriptional regulator n=1 Tax=Nocardiaceae TaxID=85025 RepID=UPI0006894735|nr:helix-turn-helix domain-containing protein [Rhodococcus fascians]